MLRMIELFSGSHQISDAFQALGWEVHTLDIEEEFNPEWCVDVLQVTAKDLIDRWGIPDAIHASPPCQAFSVCTISKNWKRGKPVTEKANLGKRLLLHTVQIVRDLQRVNPDLLFIIENPRGMMRTMDCLRFVPRHTTTYCQYGDHRQKPTDFWTNALITFKRPCSPGSSCHDRQPSGRTRKSKRMKDSRKNGGTQGLRNAYERSKIPVGLCEHIARELTKEAGKPRPQRKLDGVFA